MRGWTRWPQRSKRLISHWRHHSGMVGTNDAKVAGLCAEEGHELAYGAASPNVAAAALLFHKEALGAPGAAAYVGRGSDRTERRVGDGEAERKAKATCNITEVNSFPSVSEVCA